MTLQEIKDAVNQGKLVHWSNSGYVVTGSESGRYFITFERNQNSISLTHQDGVTLNGLEEEFYVADENPSCQVVGDGDARVATPSWLKPLLGQRELEILRHPSVRVLAVDEDGERLPPYQQLFEADIGSFWIDSQRKQIIG